MPSRPRWRVDRWAGGAFFKPHAHQLVRTCGRQCLARPLPRPLQMPWWYCGSKGAVFYLRSVGLSIISGAILSAVCWALYHIGRSILSGALCSYGDKVHRALSVHWALDLLGALRSLGALFYLRSVVRPISPSGSLRSIGDSAFYWATFHWALSVH